MPVPVSIDFAPPPAPERTESAVDPYLRAIRAHRLLIALVTLAAIVGAAAWLALRTPDYEATADILVTPLAPEDTTFIGIQVLRQDSNESTRTLQTAATLVESPRAAQIAANALGGDLTARDLLRIVEVEPQGESNILSVTATAEGAQLSARVANQFARAALQARNENIQTQVEQAIEQLEARLAALEPGDPAAAELSAQLSALNSALDGGDPTLSVAQAATVPTDAVGAPSWLVIAMAVIAGFTLGTTAALLIELLDRRIRDEDELGRLYPLPVLAHIPKLPRGALRARRNSPFALPPAVREAFRTLQLQLDRHATLPRAVMVTSASSGDGKTTSALNLASALVGAGHRVILIDFDLRKPDVERSLGVQPQRTLVSTLGSDQLDVSDLLLSAPAFPPLKVLPAGTEGDIVALEALTRRLPEILAQARKLADYVIVDTAPLGEVSDALRLIDEIDDLVVLARPGNTVRSNFELMRDLIERTGRKPTGLVVISDAGGRSSSYYSYGLAGRQQRVGPPEAAGARR